MEKAVQLKLNLFPDLTFDEIIAEKNISNLSVLFNRRLKRSWNIVFKPNHHKVLTLPEILKNAPEEIKNILINWALHIRPKVKYRNIDYFRYKKKLETIIWDYIQSQENPAKRTIKERLSKVQFNTKGIKYDLKTQFDIVNETYFNNEIQSYIRWGSYGSKISYQSHIKDYKGDSRNIITIAGVYNHPKVPQFAINAIIFHEMLHIKVPPYKKNGRNVMHGPEYKTAEKAYPYLKKWHTWEKKDLFSIYRELKRKRK